MPLLQYLPQITQYSANYYSTLVLADFLKVEREAFIITVENVVSALDEAVRFRYRTVLVRTPSSISTPYRIVRSPSARLV